MRLWVGFDGLIQDLSVTGAEGPTVTGLILAMITHATLTLRLYRPH